MGETKSRKYILLEDLLVYKLARRLSCKAWAVYSEMDWQRKKVVGNQFIRAIDSIGANIAEGYGRYHYLDKVKFYYNARASHVEAINHWLNLLYERRLVDENQYKELMEISDEFSPKLNSFIAAICRAKTKDDGK